MMLAALIAALVLAATSLTLAGYTTHKAFSWAARTTSAEVGMALARGREQMAVVEEQRAREQAREAARVAQVERTRGDYLEAEINELEANPVLDSADPARNHRARLRLAVEALAGAARPGAVAGEITVPDSPATGGTSGDGGEASIVASVSRERRVPGRSV